MELKKLEAEIEMLKNKIKEQGMITNARDEERLDNLMKVYKEIIATTPCTGAERRESPRHLGLFLIKNRPENV